MESNQFDRMTRILGTRQTRRKSLTTLAGAAAIAAGLARSTDALAGEPVACILTCPVDPFLSVNDGTCSATGAIPAPIDNGQCGGQAINCVPSSDSAFPVGSTNVVCTTADENTFCTYTLYVYDDNDIALTCPADQTIETDVAMAVTFDDPVPGTPCRAIDWISWTCDATSGDTFAMGTTTVTCFIDENQKLPDGIGCSFRITLAVPPTATPTETETPTEIPATQDPSTEVPVSTATPVPATEVPVATATTVPVTSLPNTGTGSNGGQGGMSKLLPLAVVGAGAAALVRLGLRKPADTPET